MGPGQCDEAQALVDGGVDLAKVNWGRRGHPGWSIYETTVADDVGVVYAVSKQRTAAVEYEHASDPTTHASIGPWEAVHEHDGAQGNGSAALPLPPPLSDAQPEGYATSAATGWIDTRQLRAMATCVPPDSAGAAKRALVESPQSANKCVTRSHLLRNGGSPSLVCMRHRR